MDNFWFGVNYWASHAGTDMWIKWDEAVVRQDFASLKEHGVQVLRIFPNWRDFQPVNACLTGNHQLREYRMPNDALPENPYYLSEEMLDHFSVLCRLAKEYGLQLIVGLLTGWMSGRLFLPPALQDQNLFSNVTALYFEQLLIAGFVSRMKDEPAIIAWDLGNECNCMEEAASRYEAVNWTALVTNAIRAQDQTRPIISGMHSLTMNGPWTMQDQGQWTDMLTTHPYPYWVEHADFDFQDAYRTLLHATFQTQLYSDLSGKPCLVEEIGTMGPMVCSDETAAGFLRVNLWSAWAHGAKGLLWWCAFDQDHLSQPPYDWNMVERELGLLHRPGQPKAMAKEFQNFESAVTSLGISLPPARRDGVCLLTWNQDQVGVGYMTYLLAKQAGLTLRFASCDQELPDSETYFLPSVSGGVMSKRAYEAVKQKVRDGAALYLSLNDGILSEFEAFTGFRVIRSCRRGDRGNILYDGKRIPYERKYQFELEARGGEVLARDEDHRILFGKHNYGKGTVYLLNVPIEEMLLHNPEIGDAAEIYRAVKQPEVKTGNPFVGVTLHAGQNKTYAVLINYSNQEQKTALRFESEKANCSVLYGNSDILPPFGVAVIEIK